MKALIALVVLGLLATVLVSCTQPTAVPPTSSRPLEPGDKISEMVVTPREGSTVTDIWQYCDPFVTEPGGMAHAPRLPVLAVSEGLPVGCRRIGGQCAGAPALSLIRLRQPSLPRGARRAGLDVRMPRRQGKGH